MPHRIALITTALFLGALAVTACTSPAAPALPAPAEPHDHSTHSHGTFEGVDHDAAAARVSFQKEVVPVLWQHCGSCHTAGAIGAGALTMFDPLGRPDHGAIRDQVGRILLEIQTGRMPAGKPNSVPPEQFRAIDVWSASGTPDN